MSRLAVPRGNPWFPVPPVHGLKSTSPRWSLLTPDEQHIATHTATERPVMTLVMAGQTIRDCLLDLRLARTVAHWREWSARLERVKAVLFDGRGDDDLRRQFLDPLRVRFILLGAERDEAARIAPELVESVLSLREAGGWRPPTAFRPWHDVPTADIRKPPDGEAARADAERRWIEDGRQLTASGCDWKGRYLDDELRAFSDDPPADPFLAARGPILDGFDIACLPANQRVFPPGFNRPAVECATKHVKGLLFLSSAILARVSRPESLTPDRAYAAAQQLDQLSVQLRSAWVSPELRERFHRHRRENYPVAGVIKPSAHEAVEELARRVWFAFRNAIGRVAFNDSRETDRMMHGPWHWHEVSKAVPVVREENPGLLSALDATGYQTLDADLDRESAELKESASDAGPSHGTISTRPTPDTWTTEGNPIHFLIELGDRLRGGYDRFVSTPLTEASRAESDRFRMCFHEPVNYGTSRNALVNGAVRFLVNRHREVSPTHDPEGIRTLIEVGMVGSIAGLTQYPWVHPHDLLQRDDSSREGVERFNIQHRLLGEFARARRDMLSRLALLGDPVPAEVECRSVSGEVPGVRSKFADLPADLPVRQEHPMSNTSPDRSGMVVTVGRPWNLAVDGPPPTSVQLAPHLTTLQRERITRHGIAGLRLSTVLDIHGKRRAALSIPNPIVDSDVRSVLHEVGECRRLLADCDEYSDEAAQPLRIDTGECVCSRPPSAFLDHDYRFDISNHASHLRHLIGRYTDWMTVAARTRDILAAGQPLTDSAERQLSYAVTSSEPSGMAPPPVDPVAPPAAPPDAAAPPVPTTPTPPPAVPAKVVPVGDEGGPPPPLPPDPFSALLAVATELRLKGNELAVIERIVAGKGTVKIADLVVVFGWTNPDDNWDSTRKRLNSKLGPKSWELFRHDGEARAKKLPQPKRPKAKNTTAGKSGKPRGRK